MGRWVIIAFCAAASLGTAAAQGTAAAPVKIGIINSQQAVFGTAEFKKWRTEEETKLKPRQDDLMKLQKELQDLQNQLQSGKLNQEGEAEVNAQIQTKQREGQRLQQDYQDDVNNDQNAILQTIGGRMKALVAKIAETKGLDAIFDSQPAVYFKPALDVTNDAISAYDKAYPLTKAAAK